MKKHAILFFLLSLFASPNLRAQKLISQELIWLRYFNQIRLGEKWTIGTEFEERRYMFPDRIHQRFLPRVTVNYVIAPGLTANVGVVYFQQFLPHDPSVPAFETIEWRPHQWITYTKHWGRFSLSGREMLEERWIELPNTPSTEYFFTMRNRTQLRAAYKIVEQFGEKPNSGMSLIAYEEYMFHFLNSNDQFRFDQNRFGVGVNASFGPRLGAEASVFHWFQPTNNSDEYFSRTIVHFTLFHRINL